MGNTIELKGNTIYVDGKEVSRRSIKSKEADCTDISKVIRFCRAASKLKGIKFKFD